MRSLAAVLGVACALNFALPAHAGPNVDAGFPDALTKVGIAFSENAVAVSSGARRGPAADYPSAKILHGVRKL